MPLFFFFFHDKTIFPQILTCLISYIALKLVFFQKSFVTKYKFENILQFSFLKKKNNNRQTKNLPYYCSYIEILHECSFIIEFIKLVEEKR